MKNFCLDLREHATKIIDYEKKEMIPLTKKKRKSIIRLEIIDIIMESKEVLLMISAT